MLDFDLVPADMKCDRAMMLTVGSLVAHNIAPSKISRVMSADILRFVQMMKGGFLSASHTHYGVHARSDQAD